MSGMSNKKIWGVVGIIVLIFIGIFVVRGLVKDESTPVPVVEEVTVKVVKNTIGTSVEGRPIEMYSYGGGPKHIAFVGGIHGGYEWNGSLLAYTFIEHLDQNPDLVPAGVTIDVIPSANPDALHDVVGYDGPFAATDVVTDTATLESARFNSNGVDINRNFDCKWDPKSTWRSREVSGGTAAFSEPEAMAIKNYAETYNPSAVVFWHSQANAVYASQCDDGVLPETLMLMNTYADAAGYKSVSVFDSYVVTGAADDWLASIGIPAVTVELKTHESIEWEKNLAGIKAVLDYWGNK